MERGESPGVILSLVGHSGAGKTTALVQWATYLRDRGYRLGLVKHSHHAAGPDVRGKDSQRLAECFPEWVVLASEDGLHVQGDLVLPARGQNWVEYLEQCQEGVDLVMVEGGSSAPFPKIEVVRGKPPRVTEVLGRIGEGLSYSDPRGWTAFLVEQQLLRYKGVVNDVLTRALPLPWNPQPWHAEVPWLGHDRLLGYDPESRLVVGYRGLYLGNLAYPFTSDFLGEPRVEAAVAGVPHLREVLQRFRLEAHPFLETALPTRSLPRCWNEQVAASYWQLSARARTCRSGLEQGLRECSRQYALDGRDRRSGLARVCAKMSDRGTSGEGLWNDPELLAATREWLRA